MVGPASKKRGTLYLLILNWVTGATEPKAKVITQMPGGGRRRKWGYDMGTVVALGWLEGLSENR